MIQLHDVLSQQGSQPTGHFPDWGSFPAYFAGAALVIAVYSMGRDRRDRHRSQAVKVAAWTENHEDGYTIFVRNKSDLPVTSVAVWFNEGFKDPSAIHFGKPPRADRRRTHPERIDILPPDATVTMGPYKPGPVWVTSLQFSDSNGSLWTRTHTQLRMLGSPRLLGWLQRLWLRIKSRRTDSYFSD